MPSLRASPLILACLATGCLAAAEPASLIPNGSFEKLNGAAPVDWVLPAGAALMEEKGNHFVRLTAGGAGKSVTLYRQVDVGQAKAIRISWRARWADVKRGAQPWHDARVVMDFKNADGKAVPPSPGHPFYTGSGDWQPKSLVVAVPSEATVITFMPAIFEAESGTFDIDDIAIQPADPAEVGAAKPDAKKPAPKH